MPVPSYFGVYASGSGTGARIFAISPAVLGKSVWDLDVDGPLNLSTEGTWTITPSSTFIATTKAWGGGGGGGGAAGKGGGGGFAGGSVQLTAGVAFTITVAGPGIYNSSAAVVGGGGPSSTVTGFRAGSGGGFSGITTGATDILLAGGGAGGAYGGDGGAGGGASGVDGSPFDPGATDFGKGGSSSAGGAAGTGTGGPTAGSSRQGGTGGSGEVLHSLLLQPVKTGPRPHGVYQIEDGVDPRQRRGQGGRLEAVGEAKRHPLRQTAGTTGSGDDPVPQTLQMGHQVGSYVPGSSHHQTCAHRLFSLG